MITSSNPSISQNTKSLLLVGGFNPSEKYESQMGVLFPIYEKIKVMFQTTNQVGFESRSMVFPRHMAIDLAFTDSMHLNSLSKWPLFRGAP
jgi:hypothetical protein